MDKLKDLLHELKCDIVAIPKNEENKIEIENAQDTLCKAWEELLRLYNVVGRSEQLCRTFFPDGKTTSATKCQFCGKEKWEH